VVCQNSIGFDSFGHVNLPRESWRDAGAVEHVSHQALKMATNRVGLSIRKHKRENATPQLLDFDDSTHERGNERHHNKDLAAAHCDCASLIGPVDWLSNLPRSLGQLLLASPVFVMSRHHGSKSTYFCFFIWSSVLSLVV
jgi:hypothetical protein